MTMGSDWWTGDVADLCEHFQMDISCLVDGELDEAAAARAMLHLESCDDCREFFEDTRNCLRLHRDVMDPDRLLARIATLTGSELQSEAKTIELVHRLASIFYQLGKAYVLAGTDPDWRTLVFEEAVPLESAQTQGRGFVDGVLAGGEGDAGGVDWSGARRLLNGRLKEIESPLDKGRRLLEEATALDSSHEEARLYLAYLHAFEGKAIQAAEEYRGIFRAALDEANRGHAAVGLGKLYEAEGNHRKALACFRWPTVSGLAERDRRFFFVRFNQGLQYALLGARERSLASFRALLDRHPDRTPEIAALFGRSRKLQSAIESQAGFAEELVAICPELFGVPPPRRGPDSGPLGSDPS